MKFDTDIQIYGKMYYKALCHVQFKLYINKVHCLDVLLYSKETGQFKYISLLYVKVAGEGMKKKDHIACSPF